MAQMQIPLRGHLWPVIAVVIGSWVCLQHGYFGSKKLMDAHFDAQRFPVRAADRLLGEHAPQPIFTLDSWGGYLIYRLYPEFKVVVDDRHDLYGEAFLKDYLKAIHAEPGWDLPLEQWNVNVILLPVSSPLSTVLKEDARWSIMRDDGVSILFRRR
jgi:hypothetical protein